MFGDTMRRTALALLLVGTLTSACSSDDDRTGGLGSTTKTDVDPCTDVLNHRDSDTFTKGRDAALDMVLAATKSNTPDQATLDGWRTALEAGRDQATAELEKLRDVRDEPEWDDVLAPLSDIVARYETRIKALDADWPIDRATLMAQESDAPTKESLEELGLLGRDCEVLAVDPGPVAGSEEFISRAAITCSAIVDRRSDDGFSDLLEINLGVVAKVYAKETVEPTDEQIEAVKALQREWEQTVADLAAIDADPTDATAWASVLELADNRVELYKGRAEALESGDADQIASAYDRSRIGAPGWDWGPLGLQNRDCRTVEA